jgi:hypothetical protein
VNPVKSRCIAFVEIKHSEGDGSSEDSKPLCGVDPSAPAQPPTRRIGSLPSRTRERLVRGSTPSPRIGGGSQPSRWQEKI